MVSVQQHYGMNHADGYDLEEAEAYNLISPSLWRWDADSASYVDLNSAGTIEPWQAFWELTNANASCRGASLLFPNGVSTTFETDNGNFPIPERGLHSEGNLLELYGFAEAQAKGYSLVRNYVRLDSYTDSPLPESFLIDLENGFDTVRQNNVKLNNAF